MKSSIHESGVAAPDEAEACQDRLLPRVSRTFALTIPQLPRDLRRVVTNAYLLCRAADTIEDDAALDLAQKRRFATTFVEVVAGRADPGAFSAEICPLLSPQTIEAEHDLMRDLSLVVSVTRTLPALRRAAIERCIRIMCDGMHRFQADVGLDGLPTQADLDRYCYHVGGVVGEMLTELFCDHSPDISRRRDELARLAVSFGQGLQMTNILKDQWEDRARGVCWLPREVFRRRDLDLSRLAPGLGGEAYHKAMHELLGVAHLHLRSALDYTLRIPSNEPGIRRFCFWAIHLAVCTLGNIRRRPDFASGAEIKVSRRCVANTILLTKLAGGNDLLLRGLFRLSSRGLPLPATRG